MVTKLPSRYQVERSLGEGGFGEVFKAFDSHMSRDVAVKILSKRTTGARATLAREFKALSRLRHPNLIKVYNFGIVTPNTPFFTMEYVDGTCLKEFFSKGDNLLLIERTLWQIVSALNYLHNKGILHGDIKPENIIISSDQSGLPRSKLLDFGLASALGRRALTSCGTPRFLAPEILLHGAPHSPRTDLYALGITLVESITGVTAPLANQVDTGFLKSSGDTINAKLIAAGVRNPSSLSSLIMDLCQPDLTERAASAELVLRKLKILSPEVHSHPGQLTESIFIGRSEEIRKIDSFLKPGYLDKKALILRGPTGIGKKTLAERATRIAELRRFIVVDLGGSLTSHEALVRVAETVTSNVSEPAAKRFLSDYGALTLADSSQATHLELRQSSGRAPVFYDLLVRQLHNISGSRPVLVIVPDIDRASEDLLQFVLHLIKQIAFLGSKIRLIATTNTDIAPAPSVRALQQKISASSFCESIEIGPFGEEDVDDLFNEIFGRQILSSREVQELVERTRAIPLVVMAFIRHLVSSGVIQLDNGRWTLNRRKYKESEIPEDADSTFGQALEDLSEAEETVLQVLAIHGRSTEPKNLLCLTHLPARDLNLAIENLVVRMVLRREKDASVSFSHPLYVQSALRKIPSGEKGRLHQEWADLLATQGLADGYQIARHYIEASDLGKAAIFGLKAADTLVSHYMLYDALRLLIDLRSLAMKRGSVSILQDILVRLGPIQHQTGIPTEALASYSRLYRSAATLEAKSLYLRQMAMIFRTSFGDSNRSRAILRKALRFAVEAKDLHSIAETHYQLGCLTEKTSIDHFEEAAKLSASLDTNLRLKALAQLMYRYKIYGDHLRVSRIEQEIDRRIGEASAEARKEVLFHLSLVHFYGADYQKVRFYTKEKLDLERTQDDAPGMVYSLISLAGCSYIEGSYHDMISTLEEAYNLARRYSILGSALTILANLLLAYRNLGDYGQALRMVELSEALMNEEGIEQTSSYNRIKPAELFVLLGQATEKEFRAYAKKARETALKVNNNISLGHYNMSFSRHHFNNLRNAEALRYARAALELFKKAQDRDDIALAHAQIALIELARNRVQEASPHLSEAFSIYEEIHCEYLKPLFTLGKGMLARCEGSDEARSILMDGLRTSKKMGTRETTWQIQRELALYHEGRGELDKALSFYRDAVETIKQITESIDNEKLKTSYLDVPFRKRVFAEIKALKKKL